MSVGQARDQYPMRELLLAGRRLWLQELQALVRCQLVLLGLLEMRGAIRHKQLCWLCRTPAQCVLTCSEGWALRINGVDGRTMGRTSK